ncbi:MAG: ABC transporter substrate-binding protein [Acidiferrobacterales bacterium]|nr:ABC transporter substrate-binding protein [Acidiferrobacterales bacterium]
MYCHRSFILILSRTGLAAIIMLTLFADISLSDQQVIEKPSRIVSTHLCTDQLLLLLSDHDRIASLSFFSHNPSMSAMSETARNFPVNHGFAEEIVALDPDLILTSTFGHSSILLLEKLGYQVRTIPVADSLDDIAANIRLVAEAIGDPVLGDTMASEFANRIDAVRRQKVSDRPLLAIYNQNGFTFGQDALITRLVELAGFRNLGAELGLGTAQHLPLEYLLTHQPDVLMLGDRNRYAAMANELPNHPSIRRKYADVPRINTKSHLWICGTPFVAEALDYFTAERVKLAQ